MVSRFRQWYTRGASGLDVHTFLLPHVSRTHSGPALFCSVRSGCTIFQLPQRLPMIMRVKCGCTVIVPHAHWEAYRRGSLPLQNLVSDSANPDYVSDPLPQPMWDHRSTGQL
jgi:hypothetical protein